jgi:hypothetical protein
VITPDGYGMISGKGVSGIRPRLFCLTKGRTMAEIMMMDVGTKRLPVPKYGGFVKIKIQADP